MNINDGLYLGVDGCRGGWITCILDHGDLLLKRFVSLEALADSYPEFDAFLIDMAIGLRSSADQLRPDDLARKELESRASTIFPVPCRQAVYAESEEEQKQANIRVLGKTLQSSRSASFRRSGSWMNSWRTIRSTETEFWKAIRNLLLPDCADAWSGLVRRNLPASWNG